METSGTILAFVDLPDGSTDETGRGLLSYASRLARFTGRRWGALTLVTPAGESLADFAAFGTPEITVLSGSEALPDTPALLGRALARAVGAAGGAIVLLPHNDLGATLAPVVAATLGAALLTEVTAARLVDGTLHLSRQALGGRIAETRVWDGDKPLVMTVPLRSLSQVLLPSVEATTPVVSQWQPPAEVGVVSATVTSRIPPDPQTVDLVDAEVIFSAGKGCDSATFAQLQELCRELNVSFGVTRPVYDLGWSGFERMVGQTGRTVTPRLYLALGISGSMHHVGGIKDSRRIIAVNNDPKAPIFANSDEGFVADLGEILPRLLARAKNRAGGTP
jgi:electron transfer flavoprotein alpha subunit